MFQKGLALLLCIICCLFEMFEAFSYMWYCLFLPCIYFFNFHSFIAGLLSFSTFIFQVRFFKQNKKIHDIFLTL